MSFKIDPNIGLGDILTTFSIILSVIALLIAWSKDRYLRKKEQADKIRDAAAKTLAKLERWQDLSLWLFQDIQPLFVETSEILAKDFDLIVARDFLWKRLNEVRIKNLQRILEEEIEIAYVSLYGYHSAVRSLFIDTIAQLKQEEEMTFNKLIEETQIIILSLKDGESEYTTAALGDSLRNTTLELQILYKNRLSEIFKPIDGFLADLILKSDDELLKRSIFPSPQITQADGKQTSIGS